MKGRLSATSLVVLSTSLFVNTAFAEDTKATLGTNNTTIVKPKNSAATITGSGVKPATVEGTKGIVGYGTKPVPTENTKGIVGYGTKPVPAK